jgi:hypothetical protein
VIEQEEPYEGRLSRTVPWERRGETPLSDPPMGNKCIINIKVYLAKMEE